MTKSLLEQIKNKKYNKFTSQKCLKITNILTIYLTD